MKTSVKYDTVHWLLLLVMWLCAFNTGFAQTDKSDNEQTAQPSFTIFAVPQTLIKHGIRLDFEKRLNNSVHSFSLSTIYYHGEIDNQVKRIEENDQLRGYGAELMHKIYLFSNEAGSLKNEFYVGHGPYYRSFNVDFKAYEWAPVPFENTSILEYKKVDQTKEITKYGYSAVFGVTAFSGGNLMVDCYTGYGLRFSDATSTLQKGHKYTRNFQRNFFDYGYEGSALVVGIKIGYTF